MFIFTCFNLLLFLRLVLILFVQIGLDPINILVLSYFIELFTIPLVVPLVGCFVCFWVFIVAPVTKEFLINTVKLCFSLLRRLISHS